MFGVPIFRSLVSNVFSKSSFCLKPNVSTRSINLSCVMNKSDDRRSLISSTPARDQGTQGESTISIDALIQSRTDMFPTENLPKTLFNGVPFSNIPICNVRVSKNNTVITITDPKTVMNIFISFVNWERVKKWMDLRKQGGDTKMIRSCGIEGFKNTRKGTNVAAQATAITFGNSAVAKGYNMVRVRVRGIGPGRLSAIKGLQMSGLNIISVTDNTPVSWTPQRPRKQRKL